MSGSGATYAGPTARPQRRARDEMWHDPNVRPQGHFSSGNLHREFEEPLRQHMRAGVIAGRLRQQRRHVGIVIACDYRHILGYPQSLLSEKAGRGQVIERVDHDQRRGVIGLAS